jgi:hypothetical protein
MFVFPHKIVLKTCGTTTLLKAVPYVLEIAKTHCGYESVYRLFYSRKSFMFPDKQPGPHRSWEEEVAYLDNHFGKCGSSSKSGFFHFWGHTSKFVHNFSRLSNFLFVAY